MGLVLTYHTVKDVRNFEAQVKYLVAHGYNVLSLSDYLDRYEQHKVKAKDVLITFDDGDRSVLEQALPVLKEYGCPAVLFVITELIGTDLPFWWDEIRYYTNNNNLVASAKSMSNDDRLKFLENLRSTSSLPPLKYKQLTWQDLKAMEQGGIAIANHSHTHPMFDKLTPEEIEYELRTSSNSLTSHGFRYNNIFAYPNGNYTALAEPIFTKLSIKLAFLFNHKVNNLHDKPFRISRLSVNDTTPLWKYKLVLSGLHSRIAPISKKIHKFIHK